MPTALSTTKRKFHRILDSISNASSTTLATAHEKRNASTVTLPATLETPAKKPRLARPTSTSTPSVMRPTVTSVQPLRPVSIVTQRPLPTNDGERTTPHFAPWDRAQFLERLKTYRHVDKWRSKAEKISEVEWAKRGWSCIGKETVSCVGGCGKEVVILLEDGQEDKENQSSYTEDGEVQAQEEEDEWRAKAQEQLIEKYADLITDAHDEGCLWRRKGCDDTIFRLPLAHQSTAIDNLRRRYFSLISMASELPPDPSLPENLDLINDYEDMFNLLYSDSSKSGIDIEAKDTATPSAKPMNGSHSALALALFGWQAEEGHVSGLATCTACFRRLGLWLFKPSTDSSVPSSMDRLDVVGEHREYCPWINALSQNGVSSRRSSFEGLSGWEILLRAVKTNITHKKYESEEPSRVMSEPADDAVSEAASIASSGPTKGGREDQDEKDKERWAKLRKLKQVFHIKKGKTKDRVGLNSRGFAG